jgi:hypothetical protein
VLLLVVGVRILSEGSKGSSPAPQSRQTDSSPAGETEETESTVASVKPEKQVEAPGRFNYRRNAGKNIGKTGSAEAVEMLAV